MKSNVNRNVMLDAEGIKFLQVVKLGAGFRLSKKLISSGKKYKFKTIIFGYNVTTKSPTPL